MERTIWVWKQERTLSFSPFTLSKMISLCLGTTNEVAMPTNKKIDGCSTDEFDFEDRAGSALVTMYVAVSRQCGCLEMLRMLNGCGKSPIRRSIGLKNEVAMVLFF